MIKANKLVKTFTRNEKNNKKTEFNAVDGISFSVNDGEILGILGPNGAGKTTLLRMLASLMSPTSGVVELYHDEEIINNINEKKKRIGYLSENTKLYGRISIREMLEIFGFSFGLDDSQVSGRIEERSEVLKLQDFIDNRIEKLSTGQMQRASIARCLIHNPQIYIFDEPTLGLDIISSDAILKFMKEEKKKGKTVIYSTHYMEEAQELCDRIIMIEKGRIIMSGTPEEIMEDTKSSNIREAFFKLITE